MPLVHIPTLFQLILHWLTPITVSYGVPREIREFAGICFLTYKLYQVGQVLLVVVEGLVKVGDVLPEVVAIDDKHSF